MKIIHCADLHLDSKMESSFDSEKANQRRMELLKSFENMIQFAIYNKVQVIIIAGDLFDTCEYAYRKIKYRVIDNIKNAKDIDFLYLKGNHDKSDYFNKISSEVKNLKLFDTKIKSYIYDNICISGLEFSENTISQLADINLDENMFNIFVMHGQESLGFSSDKQEIININMLKNKNIDYLALGHIHKYKFEKLDNRGYYCYSGCIEGRGFDECGEKGFVLLDIKNNSMNHEFIKIAQRTFFEIDVNLVDVDNENDAYVKIINSIKHIDYKNIIKINLIGDILDNLDIDTTYLSQKLSQIYYLVKIKNKTTIKVDYNLYKNDISLKGEFVNLIEKLDIDTYKKGKIISTGIKALLGKEL